MHPSATSSNVVVDNNINNKLHNKLNTHQDQVEVDAAPSPLPTTADDAAAAARAAPIALLAPAECFAPAAKMLPCCNADPTPPAAVADEDAEMMLTLPLLT